MALYKTSEIPYNQVFYEKGVDFDPLFIRLKSLPDEHFLDVTDPENPFIYYCHKEFFELIEECEATPYAKLRN